MTTQSRSLRLADELVSKPYAWPGGYPRYAIADDSSPLCSACCREERASIGTTTGSDGWCVVGLDINWENDSLFCSNCCSRIESAYGEHDWGDPNGGEEALTAADRNSTLLLR